MCHTVGVRRGHRLHSPCGHPLQSHVRMLWLRGQIAATAAARMAAATATKDTATASSATVAPAAVASAIVATQRTASVATRNAARILADAVG